MTGSQKASRSSRVASATHALVRASRWLPVHAAAGGGANLHYHEETGFGDRGRAGEPVTVIRVLPLADRVRSSARRVTRNQAEAGDEASAETSSEETGSTSSESVSAESVSAEESGSSETAESS